jgi:hypothetical protein
MSLLWKCTDPDTKQYGRKLYDLTYEFREQFRGEEVSAIVHLDEYSTHTIESIIRAYGYTLNPAHPDFIFLKYPTVEDVLWVIAECIFETELV